MELIKLESSIPIKAIQKDKLQNILYFEFAIWLSELLSLTDEVSAKRLEIALPAIKDHCWSMGFDEIKKMFEMYADNKLSIKPIPNYFDRILLGKIAVAYRQQKPRVNKIIKEPEMKQEEKELLVYTGVLNCFEEFKETKKLMSGYLWVYDFFFERDCLPEHNKKFKEQIMNRAIVETEKKVKEDKTRIISVKKAITEIERTGQLRNIAKNLILSDYFNALIQNNTNIRDDMRKPVRNA